jgi:hypothetical protein
MNTIKITSICLVSSILLSSSVFAAGVNNKNSGVYNRGIK